MNVSGVEGDVSGAADFGDSTHDIQGLVAVERGDLDRRNLWKLREAAPKVERQRPPV